MKWSITAWQLIKDVLLTGTGLLLIVLQVFARQPSDVLLVTGLALTVPSVATHAVALLSGPSPAARGPRESSPPAEPGGEPPSPSSSSGARMTEDAERLVRGQKGDRGAQGNQGNRGEHGTFGLTVAVRRSLLFLFALAVALAAGSLLWTAHEVRASQAAQQHEEAAQHQAGVLLGEKLCTTFSRLAALKPPAGDPAKNPSRAYDQELHATLDELGADVGCGH